MPYVNVVNSPYRKNQIVHQFGKFYRVVGKPLKYIWRAYSTQDLEQIENNDPKVKNIKFVYDLIERIKKQGVELAIDVSNALGSIVIGNNRPTSSYTSHKTTKILVLPKDIICLIGDSHYKDHMVLVDPILAKALLKLINSNFNQSDLIEADIN